MSNERLRIEEICSKASSNLAQKQLGQNRGCYPVFGASGFIQNIDSFHQEHPYIGIVKDGSGVGRVNIYPAKSSLLGTMQYIIPKSHCDLVFLAYALKSLDLSSFANGAAIPHIYFKDYGKCVIPVPPLAEQKRIVEELDLLSSIIEKQKQQLKELDTLAQSIFYYMFGDPVTNEKGWEVKPLGTIFKTTSGGTPSRKHKQYYDNGNIPWINSGDLHQTYITSATKYITQLGLENSSAKIFPINTILLAMYGATVGTVSILKIESSTNQAVCGILPNSAFSSTFIYHVLKNSKEFFIECAFGGAQPNISQQIIKKFKLITPPLSLQNLFAEKIEVIEKQKEAITKSIEETQKLFDYTMDKYFG